MSIVIGSYNSQLRGFCDVYHNSNLKLLATLNN